MAEAAMAAAMEEDSATADIPTDLEGAADLVSKSCHYPRFSHLHTHTRMERALRANNIVFLIHVNIARNSRWGKMQRERPSSLCRDVIYLSCTIIIVNVSNTTIIVSA